MLAYYPCPDVLARIPADRHAVIEASAGTGKTYTIEHLVVDRLLTAGLDLDQILVVTFTEKATGELRARVRALLTAVLEAPEAATPPEGPHWAIDAAARQRLEDVLFTFDRAPIFTIHGFCHRVLFDLAFESGQLFEFEIVDGARAFNRAFREALRHTLSVEPDHRGLLRTWLDEGRDEAGLERLLLQAHRQRYLEAGESVESTLPVLLDGLRAEFDAGALITDIAGTAIQRKAFEAAERQIRDIGTLLDAPLDAVGLLEALARLPLADLLKPRRVAARTKRHYPDELAEPTRVFLDRLQRVRTTRALAASLERAVVDAFLPEVARRLTRFKRQEGLLDYDDLLDRVWEALEGPDGPGLTQTLRDRYKVALIDEFQDTDDRQWNIFQRVFVESEAHRLCVIGDPKQAIYAFRGADVHTYLRARADLEAAGAPRVALDTNYRSSAPLIAGINAVLDQSAPAPLFTGAIRYDVPVKCGKPALRLEDAFGDAQPPVVLWRYKPPPPGPRSRQTLPKYMLQEAFAGQVARSLHRLLCTDEGRLYIVEGEARRAIGPRDCFVLVRGNWDAVDAAAALRRVGVPYAFYKQEGLFQTREATDVRDVLAAVADPHDRSARMRALATPFFGVSWAGLRDYTDLPGGHPLLERMYGWHQLASQERYARLFNALLHESGIVERALFLDETERALCNYQHILEVLLEQGGRRRLSLPETIELLDRFIDKTELPDGGEGNIQRLPDERDAVQIMTIHRAKGLEAPVVCLFGGFGQHRPSPVTVVHDPRGERRVLVGEAAREANAAQLAREEAEEDQRLLYVALTRAQVRLYVPWIDSTRQINGSYAALKDRLVTMAKDGGGDLAAVSIAVEVPEESRWKTSTPPSPKEPLEAWDPPRLLLEIPESTRRVYDALRARSAPLTVTSYTRMKEEGRALGDEEPTPMEPDEFKTDSRAQADETLVGGDADRLPGGRHVGRFLHEVIEALDFAWFDERPDFESWAADDRVVATFAEVMRRHAIEPRWRMAGQGLIYGALARPLPMRVQVVPALYACRHVVELEFLYPLPETHHPLLGQAGDGWRAERGFVKGFVDYIFEHEGRIYFADWKSDVLRDYGAATLDPHVAEHYELQARLYSLGVMRWLRVRTEADYEARFGGLLYIFLRGLGAGGRPGDGVYFRRPAWADVQAWERELLEMGDG